MTIYMKIVTLSFELQYYCHLLYIVVQYLIIYCTTWQFVVQSVQILYISLITLYNSQNIFVKLIIKVTKAASRARSAGWQWQRQLSVLQPLKHWAGPALQQGVWRAAWPSQRTQDGQNECRVLHIFEGSPMPTVGWSMICWNNAVYWYDVIYSNFNSASCQCRDRPFRSKAWR